MAQEEMRKYLHHPFHQLVLYDQANISQRQYDQLFLFTQKKPVVYSLSSEEKISHKAYRTCWIRPSSARESKEHLTVILNFLVSK